MEEYSTRYCAVKGAADRVGRDRAGAAGTSGEVVIKVTCQRAKDNACQSQYVFL